MPTVALRSLSIGVGRSAILGGHNGLRAAIECRATYEIPKVPGSPCGYRTDSQCHTKRRLAWPGATHPFFLV